MSGELNENRHSLPRLLRPADDRVACRDSNRRFIWHINKNQAEREQRDDQAKCNERSAACARQKSPLSEHLTGVEAA